MIDIRDFTRTWPRRARLARRMAYAAYAAVGAFGGLAFAAIVRAA